MPENKNNKITWSEFGKFIGITTTVLVVVLGGVQYYFSSQNDMSERLIRVEQQVKTIKQNDLNHIENTLQEMKDCQDDQGDRINKIDKTSVQILEKIKIKLWMKNITERGVS